MGSAITGVVPRVAAAPNVEVWDMSSGVERLVPPEQVRTSTDPILRDAWKSAAQVTDYLRTAHGRDGIDGAGSPLRIVVHVNDDIADRMNAQWHLATGRVYLGDGDGSELAPLGASVDVMMHEATHGILRSRFPVHYDGQRGGVDESFADVMGALADPDDWLIGEDVYTPNQPGDAIRDLEHPRFSHTDQLASTANVGVHELSGIPSLAAVRVAGALGREEMGRIWYSALTDHLDQRSGFAGAARATLDAAVELHGASSQAVGSVLDAWKSVGVNPRWKAPTAGSAG